MILASLLSGCVSQEDEIPYKVPHLERWGIYALDLESEEVSLIYSTSKRITTIRLNPRGDTFVFSHEIDGEGNEFEEICTIGTDGNNFNRVTANNFWDLYPTWGSDNERLLFLSFRNSDLDLYMVDHDGTDEHKFFDSGKHDADVHWANNTIAFTSGSRIWTIIDNGTNPSPLTDPKDAGQWGNANLPFGDYDPQLDPAANRVVFERLEDDQSPHGNYNIFSIEVDGKNEKRLTDTGYSQGFPSWSHNGDMIVFLVAAIDDKGLYDIFLMDYDGSDQRNITPDYFPNDFLCHSPIFSNDDKIIFFIGEWWNDQ